MHRFACLTLVLMIGLCSREVAGQTNFFPMEFTTFRHPAPGYYLFAPNSIDSLGLLDHGGKIAHAFAARGAVNMAWQNDNTISYLTDARKYFRRATDFTVIDTIGIDGYDIDFHEFRVLSNGNLLVLGYDQRTIDMSSIIPNGNPNARVVGTILREITPAGTVAFEWSSFDHVDITEATEDIDLTQPAIDYMHVNSVFEDLDGNFLMSARHFDAVLKINRITGQVMWRLGGEKARKNDFLWVNDDVNGYTGFSHQHTVIRTSSGKMLMFDNGNLKPNSYSRAVMYDVNEQNKTITKVWEYRQTPDVFAASMGSVQELPNGNILIGWGSAPTRFIATEVDPSGLVQAELATPQANQVKSYRVMKAPFSMTGVQKTISTTGVHDLAAADSTTHLSIDVSAVTQSTSLIVERHWNTLREQTFAGDQPCLVLPARWSVRTDKSNTITGSMTFKVGNVPGIDVPDLVAIYHRSTEGSGVFTKVNGTYTAATKTFKISSFKTGEYVACYLNCMIPFLTSPLNGSGGHAPAQVRLTWSPAIQTLGYHVQVSSNPTFATVRNDQFVNAEEFTVSSLASFTTYYWRVRTRRDDGFGQWSAVWSFKTSLLVPGPISPRYDGGDTVSVIVTPTLSWTSVVNAKTYHVRVYAASNPSVVVAQDTVSLRSWQTPALHGNTWYTWQVRAISDTAVSAFSSLQRFLTAPPNVRLLLPEDGQDNVSRRNARLTWTRSPQAIGYQVRVTLDTIPSAIIDSTLADTVLALPRLIADTTYRWTVRPVGKYGRGSYAPERSFQTAPEGVLAAPTLIAPVSGTQLARDQATLRWSLDEATMYRVEIATSASFDTVVYAVPTFIYTTMIVPIDVLEDGKTYFWRVQGRTEQMDGLVSAVWNFTITSPPPPPDVIGLQPLAPLQGAKIVPLDGTFRWTRDSRTDVYEVLLFKGSSDAPERILTSTDTTVDYSALAPSTSYRWFVRGMRKGVAIDSGDVASFETESIATSVQDLPVRTGDVIGDAVLCDAGTVHVTVVDVAGRLVEQAFVPIVDGSWRYRSVAHGMHFVTITACGDRRTMLWIGR